LVGQVQAMYLLQIPFYLLNLLGVRLLNALNKSRVIFVASGVSLISNIVLNLILMKIIGVAGIALSTSISYLIVLPLVFIPIFRSTHPNNSRPSAN